MIANDRWKTAVDNNGTITQVYVDEGGRFHLVVYDSALPSRPWAWLAHLGSTCVGNGRTDTEGMAKHCALDAAESALLTAVARILLQNTPALSKPELCKHLQKAVVDAELHLGDVAVEKVASEAIRTAAT